MKQTKLILLLISLVFTLSANAAEKIYFIHTDQLGTPNALTDDAQNIVWKAGDDPFGDAPPAVNSINNNLRFPGQYYDPETGLHYNWNRYYDPETGRYVTSDPIGLYGGPNTYGYVAGNPLMYSDPMGLNPLILYPLLGASGAAVGGCLATGACSPATPPGWQPDWPEPTWPEGNAPEWVDPGDLVPIIPSVDPPSCPDPDEDGCDLLLATGTTRCATNPFPGCMAAVWGAFFLCLIDNNVEL